MFHELFIALCRLDTCLACCEMLQENELVKEQHKMVDESRTESHLVEKIKKWTGADV